MQRSLKKAQRNTEKKKKNCARRHNGGLEAKVGLANKPQRK